jgi:hypothetical protein
VSPAYPSQGGLPHLDANAVPPGSHRPAKYPPSPAVAEEIVVIVTVVSILLLIVLLAVVLVTDVFDVAKVMRSTTG